MRRLAIAVALFGLTLAPPAVAQVNGQWTTPFGEARLELDNRSGFEGRTPPWIATSVDINASNSISFIGDYRNLVWEGRWFFYGGRAPRGIAFRPCAQPHRVRVSRRTRVYGRYRVTFNAAENRFEGVMSNCNLAPTSGGGTQPFEGTRNNTYAYSDQPESRRETREVPSRPFNPGPAPMPTPDQEAARAAGASERACEAFRNQLPVTWSSGFATHPCIVNAGDNIEIITRTDQTQRPMTVIYRAFHFYGRGLGVRLLRLDARRGLANQGVPRAGTRYRGQFDLALCREGTWLVSLLMSDGTETDPIGMIRTGDARAPLLGRSCNPGSHTHELDDYLDPDGLRQFYEPLSPSSRR